MMMSTMNGTKPLLPHPFGLSLCTKKKSDSHPVGDKLYNNQKFKTLLDLLSKGGYEVTSPSSVAPSFMSLFLSATGQMARNMKTQEIHRNGNVF